MQGVVRAVQARGESGMTTYKVDANGRYPVFMVSSVSESVQQARLADTAIAEQHELKEVVAAVGETV